MEVPGRLCLLGEHSDWAGAWRTRHPEIAVGRCLVTATTQGLRATAWRRSDATFVMSVPEGDAARTLRVRLDALETEVEGRGYFSYVAGVAEELRARGLPVGGLDVHVTRADLPVRKGLSSSAAACVLVARAFNHVHGLGLAVEDEMDVAYRGERRAGSECGRMDQVCALGPGPSLLSFDGDSMDVQRVTAGRAIPLLVVDLRAAKDTRRILADLQRCFPDTPGERAAAVREALGDGNAVLVEAGRYAVQAGDARRLGEVMSEAQARFDERVAPACPELAAPVLHAVLDSAAARELAWGGKGVGSQGDGCAQLVARGPGERAALRRRLEAELGVRCFEMDLGGGGA